MDTVDNYVMRKHLTNEATKDELKLPLKFKKPPVKKQSSKN